MALTTNNQGKKVRKVDASTLFRQLSRKFSFSYQKFLSRLFSIGIIGIVVTLVRFLFGSSLFGAKYISYDTNALIQYSNPEFYTALQIKYNKKNTLRLWLGGYQSAFKALQETYPFLNHVNFTISLPNTIHITPLFQIPRFLFRIRKKELIMTYNKQNFLMQPQDAIATTAIIIDIPSYTQDTGSIKGIYARISQEKFDQSLSMIQDVFGSGEIVAWNYIPGGGILEITLQDKKVLLFHLSKDMNQQLVKRLDLKDYFTELGQYTRIDLGSMEFIVVK
jgi:hypothetical protein